MYRLIGAGTAFMLLPDEAASLLGERVSGDEIQAMQNMVQERFLLPDSEGNVKGIPQNFVLFAEQETIRRDTSIGGMSSRMGLRMATQEVTMWLLFGTRDARKFLQDNGFLTHMDKVEDYKI